MAVVIDISTFRQLFPEFADATKYTDGQIQGAIAAAETYFPAKENCFLSSAHIERVIYLLTAIMLKSYVSASGANNSNQGGAGAVQSASVGSVSVSYALPQRMNDITAWLYSYPPYGQELSALLSSLGSAGFYIGGSLENVLR
jgi:hypothetical protein